MCRKCLQKKSGFEADEIITDANRCGCVFWYPPIDNWIEVRIRPDNFIVTGNYCYEPQYYHFIVDGEELLGNEREDFVETYSENPYWAENLQIRK